MSLNPNKYGVSVKCTVCGLTKPPVGRSVAGVAANGMCSSDCSGFDLEPLTGSLWPDESEAEFGYDVGDVGTRIITQQKEPR